MEDLGIPELTSEQIEQLCNVAEGSVRDYIHSKAPKKEILTLNIITEAVGTKPVNLSVSVEVVLSLQAKRLDVQKLVNNAVSDAFQSAEGYLRELACHSQK